MTSTIDSSPPDGMKKVMKVGKNPEFVAILLKDDQITGFKKGFVFHPKGLHWTEDGKVVLVGEKFTDEQGNLIKLSFPEEDIDIEVVSEVIE